MDIFLLEDDEAIGIGLTYSLENEGYNVTLAKSVKEAEKIIDEKEFSLYILDLTLPDGSGYDVCKRIKAKGDLPVIFLTAYDDEVNVIMGFELGADDYITKPFGVMELLSRIKAVLRRAGKQNAEADVIEEQGVSLDASRRICSYNGQEVVLTYKEFELLMYLMRHKSIAVSRDKLMEMVWGYEFAGETRTVDMHIKTLRQKLEAAGCTDLIKTVRGVGYKI